MPFVSELPKDVLEEAAEERLHMVGTLMKGFQEAFQEAQEHDEDVHEKSLSGGWRRLTPEIKNQVLTLGKEALGFYKQGKHLFMYRHYVDSVEAMGIAERKLQLGMEILEGLYRA